MSEHPIAAFADQVQPGMRVSHAGPCSEFWAEPVFISQVRIAEHLDSFAGLGTTVHFLGVYDDGRPFAYMAGPQMAVLIHDLTPAEFLGGLT